MLAERALVAVENSASNKDCSNNGDGGVALTLLDELDGRMADCLSQANEGGDVDHVAATNPMKNGRRGMPLTAAIWVVWILKPGISRDTNGSPPGVMQELRCVLQNSARVKPASDTEQAVPPQSRKEFPANQRPRDDGEKSGGNKHQRTELP